MDAPLTKTYQIPEYHLEGLAAKLNKLARKAESLGVPAPTWVIGPLVLKKFNKRDDHGTFDVPCRVVEVSTNRVSLSGWRFCGYIEHFKEGNRLYALEELPTIWRTASSQCSHCRLDRRRSGTYVVHNEESGEYAQVGSTCLDDFVGTESGASIAASCSLLRDLQEIFDEGSWDVGGVSLHDLGAPLPLLLCYVLESICRAGYVPRKVAEPLGQMSTGDIAFMLLGAYKERKKAWPDIDEAEILERHSARAEAIVTCWTAAEARSDFDHNCQLISRRGIAKGQDANLVAAMVSVYDRKQADAARAAGGVNAHVGEVGGKIELEVTVDALIPTNGIYPSIMHRMRDTQNRALVWFASSTKQGFEPGKRYLISATIKKHEDRNGVLSTVLTRCTIKKVLA